MSFWIKAKWMIVSLIFPEFLVGKALQELVVVRRALGEMKNYADDDRVQWTTTHSFFANMGGFGFRTDWNDADKRRRNHRHVKLKSTLRERTDPARNHAYSKNLNLASNTEVVEPIQKISKTDPSSAQEDITSLNPPPKEAEEACSITEDKVILGEASQTECPAMKKSSSEEQDIISVILENGNPPGVQDADGKSSETQHEILPDTNREVEKAAQNTPDENMWAYPSAEQLYFFRENNIISRLPEIPEKDINDKSKGDAFIKSIAVIQVLWLIIQISVRAQRNLPISQLELAVSGFCFCAIFAYAFQWSKPQNVTTPILIQLPTPLIREEIKRLRVYQEPTNWFLSAVPTSLKYRILDPPPNHIMYTEGPLGQETKVMTWLNFGIVIAGVAFGALHCAAWDFSFATPTDLFLWRISAVGSTVLLPPFYLWLLLYQVIEEQRLSARNYILSMLGHGLLIFLFSLAYVLCRLCLIVLMFRSVFYLPPSAFIATWSSEFPHV
jgi:hypothetical protein